MKVIIKQVVKGYLKNPVFWIGIMIIAVGMFQQLHPYLNIHYISSEQEVSGHKEEPIREGDIADGYVPSSPEQQREIWEKIIRNSLITDLKISESEAESFIQNMRKLDIEQAFDYLEKEYGYYGAISSYENASYHQGTMEEINFYLVSKLKNQSFSFYFARKFVDFAGLYMGFFAIVLMAVLYIQDTRKNTYELLHTKPISAANYVVGKVLGGFFTCCIVLGVLTIIFYLLSLGYTRENGFEIYLWDFIEAVILYILPNMLMIVCVYTMIALLFKNPLPAVPLLFLYMVYSNMGSRNAEGIYDYYGRALAIMVRFPGQFFETAPPPMVYLNQMFLIVASLLIIFVSIQMWKRRRVY